MIESKRLFLRPYEDKDLSFFYNKIFADKEVMKWLLCARPMNKIEIENIINKYFPHKFNPYGLGTLCIKKTNECIGYAGLIRCDYVTSGDFEIGFALKQEKWGKGYATEIGIAETEFALNSMKLDRILSLTHPENLASIKVIKKLGYNLLSTINVDNRGLRNVYVKESFHNL